MRFNRKLKLAVVGVGVAALTVTGVTVANAEGASAAAKQCSGNSDGNTYWAKDSSGRKGGGYVRLYWDGGKNRNCVKFFSSPYDGKASKINVTLWSDSGDYASDPPQEHPENYHYYAGPVYTWYDSSGQCVKATGSLVRGGKKYTVNTGRQMCD